MHDRPSASVTRIACGMVSGYSPPCSRFSKTNPVPVPQGSCGRFSGVISSNSWVFSTHPAPQRSSCPYPILALSLALFASTVGVSRPRGLTAPAGLRLEPIDLLGGFGLGEVRLDRFLRFFGERLEIGRLRAGHLLVTRDPVIGVFDAIRVLVCNLVGLHVLRNRCSVVVLLNRYARRTAAVPPPVCGHPRKPRCQIGVDSFGALALTERQSTMIREMLGIAEGILQDLHNDHGEVDSLMDRITESADGAEREALFEEMKTKLLAHAHAEQEVLYRPLQASQSESSRSFALEGANEHQILEKQLQKLSAEGDKTSEQWTAELKVLRELVEHHVDEEESTGFSCARHDFRKDELEAMAQRFQTCKAQLLTRVAP